MWHVMTIFFVMLTLAFIRQKGHNGVKKIDQHQNFKSQNIFLTQCNDKWKRKALTLRQ